MKCAQSTRAFGSGISPGLPHKRAVKSSINHELGFFELKDSAQVAVARQTLINGIV